MKMKRIISLVIVLLLVCGMPAAAFADTYDLANGSITVSADVSGQYVTQTDNGIDHQADANPVITQTITESAPSTTNTITINAAENATANVTIQDVNINTGSRGGAAIQTAGAGNVVIELDGTNTVQSSGANAGVQKTNGGNLTIADENGTDGSLKATGGRSGAGIGGGSAVSSNSSDITISGGTIEAIGGDNGAGIGGGAGGSGSNITITGGKVTATGKGSASGIGGGTGKSGSNITISGGDVEATGGQYGAGIGGGAGGSGSNITITGSTEVTAKGGESGAGIGGGRQSTGSSDITVSGDAQVKAQGGCDREYPSAHFGSGAAIGEGGSDGTEGSEVEPNTNALTTKGKIEYYAPGAKMETDNPIKTVTGTVPPQDEEKPPVDEEKPDRPSQPAAEGACYAPLYRVINQDGKDIPHQAERKDGVLTVTVDADFAALTGKLGGIQTLKAQGVDTIVFVTKAATSAFALSDLLSQGSTGDSYTLNHNGAAVSFTLDNGADLGTIMSSRI